MSLNSNIKPVVIIPARGGSKGIPSKNLYLVAGKPLLAWSIEAAMKSKYLEGRVYVSSDDRKILDLAESLGAKGILRPPEFSTDTATSESALIHGIGEIEKLAGASVEDIVFLQATSPVRERDDIDRAYDKFLSERADSLFSARPLQDFFLWKQAPESMVSINFDFRKRLRRQEISETFLENGSIYIFKKKLLLQDNNRLGGKIAVYPMPIERSFQIDNLEDILVCEYFLKKIHKSSLEPKFSDSTQTLEDRV